MKTGKSPFYYGGVVRDVHFCNRIKEIKELEFNQGSTRGQSFTRLKRIFQQKQS